MQGRCFDEDEVVVPRELAREKQERLFDVVVALGTNVAIRHILLAVERDLQRLDHALLDIDLVPGEDNGDVLAHAG